jgi:hypothetical protein
MILNKDVAFFILISEFEFNLKASKLYNRNKQAQELLKIFEFNNFSEEMKNSSNKVFKILFKLCVSNT